MTSVLQSEFSKIQWLLLGETMFSKATTVPVILKALALYLALHSRLTSFRSHT